MVFVHGWLNSASVWNGVVDELQSTFRCISVDLAGHGRSAPTGAGTYGRDAVLDDLRRVLEAVAADGAIFVGHSLGGYLSLALAIESPHLVDGLGLVASGPGFRNPTAREQWNDSVIETAAGRDLPDGIAEMSMHVDAMVIDRLSEIDVPVAVVVGERDTRFLASADVFEKYLDVRECAVLVDGGHMVHAKAPVEVAAVLRRVFAPA